VLTWAQRIAGRLAPPKPAGGRSRRRGPGLVESQRYRWASDDLDLDRTIEVLAELPMPSAEDIVVRERLRRASHVVLVIDVSGSMRGERLSTAAATIGALVEVFRHDNLAILAFWSDVAIVRSFDENMDPVSVLGDLVSISARGLTNIAFPLEVCRSLLQEAGGRQSRVILLSDCLHNAGPDPRVEAALLARIARLDVLVDTSGECDRSLAVDLALEGDGRSATISNYLDVASAAQAVLSAGYGQY
jgi:Mg-chelatase subunit ChlD